MTQRFYAFEYRFLWSSIIHKHLGSPMPKKESVHQNITTHLCKYFPFLLELSSSKREYYCKLAIDLVRGQNPHWHYANSVPLISRQRNSVMSASDFEEINKTLGFYEVKPNYSPGRYARPCYLVNNLAQQLIQDWISSDNHTPHPMTDYKGSIRNTPPRAIISKDKSGNQRKSKGQLRSSLIPIDIDSLKKLSGKFDACGHTDMRYKADSIIQASRIDQFDAHLPLQYREDNSGRLQGVGFHLQNTSKEIRNAALTGQYNYDIDACHPALMYGICLKHGIELQEVSAYITDKSAYRKLISEQIGIDEMQIKIAITALAFGARLSANNAYCSVPSIFNPDGIESLYLQEQTEDFINNKIVKNLAKEFRDAHNIITKFEVRKSNSNVINILRKRKSIRSSKTSSVVSHILMGYEAKALDIAIQETGGNISLLLHDGFIVSQPIDTQPIVDRFCEETDLEISYSMDRIA